MTRIGAESGRCRWVLGLAVMVVLSLLAFGSARAEEFDLSGLGPDAQAALGPIRYASAVSMRQPPPAEKPRAPLLRRQRPNTISIGIQGDYGIIRGNSRLADGFSDGPGYSFRFRYMLAPSFALGFSFESQRFYDKGGLPSTELGAGDSTVVMTTVGMEGVFYIHREREVNPYFVTGFGYASPDVVDEVRGSARVNEGMFLVMGAGLERFIRPRFSLDFTLRGEALISNSEFTGVGTISAGIHLYPGD
ncbi:MAG TPA: hypothetical protein VL857_03960 [Candidatus Eisenbacteria bacterium]|nr:hypothetical protein [Candidatus Eisenbacteria bacterium]